MRLVRAGDERAFEEIDRRYRRRLSAYAASLVPASGADDVVQEALLKASQALNGGDGEIHLRPWLYRIVHNTALNSLRDAPPPHEELDLEFDGVPQPPDIVARREEIRELVAAIKALPEQQREAIVQREMEGRSHDEIAGALGISIGAVRQLIFRARQTLRSGVAVFLPLPKAAFAIFAVSGTVIGGVAVQENVIHHHRHRAPHTTPAAEAPANLGGLVTPGFAEPVRSGFGAARSESAGLNATAGQTTAAAGPARGVGLGVPAPSPGAIAGVPATVAVPSVGVQPVNDQGQGGTRGQDHGQGHSQDQGASPGLNQSQGHDQGQSQSHDQSQGGGHDLGQSHAYNSQAQSSPQSAQSQGDGGGHGGSGHSANGAGKAKSGDKSGSGNSGGNGG